MRYPVGAVTSSTTLSLRTGNRTPGVVAVTVTRPTYVPGSSPVVSTVTAIDPGVSPLVGLMSSQDTFSPAFQPMDPDTAARFRWHHGSNQRGSTDAGGPSAPYGRRNRSKEGMV